MPALTDANLAYKIMCSLEFTSIHSKIKGCDINLTFYIFLLDLTIFLKIYEFTRKTSKNLNKYVFPTIPTFFQKLFIYID